MLCNGKNTIKRIACDYWTDIPGVLWIIYTAVNLGLYGLNIDHVVFCCVAKNEEIYEKAKVK